MSPNWAVTLLSPILPGIVAALLFCSSSNLVAQDPSDRLKTARDHMANQRLDRAEKEVQKILAVDPASVEAWKLSGEIRLRMADLEGALLAWTEASRLDPDSADLLVSIGDLLIRRNDRLDEALAVFDRSLALEPGNTRVLLSKGSIHERREQWSEAAEAYRSAILIDPNLVRARSSLGAVLFKLGSYDEASQELRKAIELSPKDLRSHVFLGLSQNHLGRYDVAISELKEALLLDPHSANQLIGVREQQPQFLRLIELFVAAYEANPREAGRSYDLAVIYFYAQNYDSAWKYLLKAEQLRYPIPIELKEVVWSKRRLRSP